MLCILKRNIIDFELKCICNVMGANLTIPD